MVEKKKKKTTGWSHPRQAVLIFRLLLACFFKIFFFVCVCVLHTFISTYLINRYQRVYINISDVSGKKKTYS